MHTPPASRLIVVSLVVLALLAASALMPSQDANARIVPGKGLAGLRLDMTKKEVRAKLGRPDEVRKKDVGYSLTVFVYRKQRLYVDFASRGRVLHLTSRSPRERTRDGLGVGSTLREVRAARPKIYCQVSDGVGFCSDTYRDTWIALTFKFKNSRVTSTSVEYIDAARM